MAGFYNLDHKEVIRIKVKKCDGRMKPEYKKFSIDPQITSFEMLQGILARAFEINSDFTICYLAIDSEGQAVYLSMLSDWDMDAAFQCAADPCLKLKVDLRPFEEELEDWDVIAPAEIPQHRITSLLDKGSILGTITGTITHNLGKTVNTMQRAIGLKHADEVIKPLKPPMSDMEFKNYLDSEGHMIRPNEFRLSVYQGGIEPSLRRVAWRHLLNIFPVNMSGQHRFDYMKRKEEEYRRLREEWRERFKNNTATEEVKYVASMVKKDVLRTDRCHGFYAGSDENENTLSLFHILVTYALTHPDVSYCQGMSDLASPLLVTQKDEGQAYICFCALMNRLRSNFTVEGNAIMTKFKHLSELLAMYDPVLHSYLLQKNAGDLFFCYRWFLLELKREFPFTDALYVLEVMWATLPPFPPPVELELVDSDYSCKLFSSSPCSPTFTIQQAMYAKLLAMRRVGALHLATQAPLTIKQKPAGGLSSDNQVLLHPTLVSSYDASPVDTDDHGSDFPQVDNPMTRSMQMKSNSIDQILQEDGSLYGKEDSTIRNADNSSGDSSSSDSSQLEEGAGEEELNRVDSGHSSCISLPVEECKSFTFTNILLEEENHERSWSVNSVVSDFSDPPTQFELSLDSNANNSTDNIELHTIHSYDSSKSNEPHILEKVTRDVGNGKQGETTESNSGIFQSMKRLLSSPKKKPTDVSPQASPRMSGGPLHKQGSAPILSPDHEMGLKLAKNYSDGNIADCKDASESIEGIATNGGGAASSVRDPSKLPPPQEFGEGNPFLMFLCLTLLVQHRDKIIQQGMFYEDIAMHFDKLVRRHDASRALHNARQLYTEYLRAQQSNMEKDKDVEDLGFSC
ncbi:TBC1 domain family member 25-like isoform X1 [Biomphalaria glabrata]|uniref:TBC1 domain family member 25-like isoform X1 n=2 Tax=Biomphalaria glabrata TaxID=6526 RepID=A0A9W3A3P0_BIOGL|nr:TBC1 domain family member 25-like isoform X1 [Biomphalaria glabrata]XP_055881797.1 TBC1 domain family member 25-like isoform X1 [Biomphalaria glabrata]XP_055881798.1 TBC1 domain family member 25-like isoform X1 [Biomphalaria glabrata]XP_055881800.1 TBC1 domain family member 25-like isoform X1 [Biomphalaria glabrata]